MSFDAQFPYIFMSFSDKNLERISHLPQLYYMSRCMKTVLLTFCFREVYEKVNLTWNANHTVTYQRMRNWYFDAEHSNGSLDDTVVMLNIVPVVLVPQLTISLLLTLNRE
jgi:hypothetical protein